MAAASLAVLLTTTEALSGIFGSISLAIWIFLLVPQVTLNYKTGSAEGISLASLTVWLMGDLANLAGAVWAGLVPTVIATAIYFCCADFVLISQCLYYNHINARRRRHFSISRASEDEPLLARQQSNDTVGLARSRRRSSAARSCASDFGHDTLSKILEEDEGSNGGPWIRNIRTIALVALAGLAGWAIAWRTGIWTPTPKSELSPESYSAIVGMSVFTNPEADSLSDPFGAKVLGFFSSVCYLGARIPQIIKNHRAKSCEGLSLLFFMMSLTGNVTYGAGILFHSLEKAYLLKNLPWLIGSFGTMIEDCFIFMQFRIYAPRKTSSAIVS